MVWRQVYDLVNNSSDMLWQIFKPSFSFCMYKPKNIGTHWNREVSNTKRCCETEEISLHPRWKATQLYKEMPFWVLQQGNTRKTLSENPKLKARKPAFPILTPAARNTGFVCCVQRQKRALAKVKPAEAWSRDVGVLHKQLQRSEPQNRWKFICQSYNNAAFSLKIPFLSSVLNWDRNCIIFLEFL